MAALQAQIDQAVRTHLRYFSHGLFDRSVFWFGDEQKIYDHSVYVDEHHWLDAKAQQRPIIVLAPHFIGLDVGGLRINMDMEMATMYQKQRNPVFDALMLEGRMRSGQGHLFSRHDGVRGLVKLLRKNIPLYYLPDMDFGINDAVFSTFFGQNQKIKPDLVSKFEADVDDFIGFDSFGYGYDIKNNVFRKVKGSEIF